jgi:ABC-type bacteriocin/lantibiotic exporter with double-glycine peptidase domain
MKIPFFPQLNEHYCGPAILQMTLAAYGIEAPQERLAQEARTPLDMHSGTELVHMVAVLRSYGLEVDASQNRNIEAVVGALQKDAIVIICYTEPVEEWGHYAIVKEFRGDNIVLIDPDSRTGETSLLTEEFERRWQDPLFTKSVRWAAFVSKK